MRAFALVGLLMAALLAGCSSPTPAGEFATTRSGLELEGTADNAFVAFEDPLLPPNAPPNVPRCLQDNVPATPPEQRCTQPSSAYALHFMDLPQPGASEGYVVVATNATAEFELGPLAQDPAGMWAGNFTFDEDHSGRYEALELRLQLASGAFVLGSAPAGPGQQNFQLDPMAQSPSATAAWKGKDLTLTVSGLPANATYTGWLVSTGEGGEHLHEASFPVHNGEVTFTAERRIDEFVEFHIHVGGSLVNVAIADIQVE